jgi:transglutaminase-like putative cysteine protease
VHAAVAAFLVASADAVFLSHEATVTLRPAGAVAVEESREVLVPLTAAGTARYSTLSIPFNTLAESVEVLEAGFRPVRPGRPDSEASIIERPVPGLAAAARLESNFREYLLTFDGLETGDTIVIRTRRTVLRLPLADAFSYSFYFQAADSVASSRFTLSAPCGLEVRHSGWGEPALTSSNGVTTRRWTCGPMSPLGRAPLGIPTEAEASRVVVADMLPSEVGRELWEALDPGSPDGSPLAAAVLDSVGTDPDTLRAWVASRIAYLGSSIGTEPGYSPRPPEMTLQERCGVCRDKSVLLLWLLRAAGRDAWLGLTRSTHPLDGLCGVRDFDHMVVILREGDELSVLDPSTTSHTTRSGMGLRGLPVLPVAPWCEGYITIPEGGGDTLSIVMHLALASDLSVLEGDFAAGMTGAVDEVWRNMLERVPAARWPELCEALFGADPASSLEVAGDPLDPLAALSVSGRIVFRAETARGGDTLGLVLPGLLEASVMGSRLSALILARSDGRPAGPDTPMLETLEAALELPAGLVPEVAPGRSVDGYSLGSSAEGGSVRWGESCDLTSGSPAELRDRVAARCSVSGRLILLSPGGGT